MQSNIIKSIVIALLFAIPNVSFAQDLDTPITRMVPIEYRSDIAYNESPVKTANEWWNWTKPAAYHKAVVRVSVSGAAGTGCIVDHDGEGLIVITNKHVVFLLMLAD